MYKLDLMHTCLVRCSCTCIQMQVCSISLKVEYTISIINLIAVCTDNYFCFSLEESFTESCQFSEWGEWTQCSRTCGTGRKARSRNCSCLNEDVLYMDCKGELLEFANCAENPCRGLRDTGVYLEHVRMHT